jgi:hypothetical protein
MPPGQPPRLSTADTDAGWSSSVLSFANETGANQRAHNNRNNLITHLLVKRTIHLQPCRRLGQREKTDRRLPALLATSG